MKATMKATIIAAALTVTRSTKLPYGNPYKNGCTAKELNLSIAGVPGLFCSPKCSVIYENGCNPAKAEGLTAMPECMIGVNSTENNYCALICNTDAPTDQCDTKGGASCHHVSGVQGVCTYTLNEDKDEHLSLNKVSSRVTTLFNASQPATDPLLVKSVNGDSSATWVAEASSRFHGWTLGRASNIANGALLEGDTDNSNSRVVMDYVTPGLDIPTDFDPRQDPSMASRCNATIAHVRDQTDCGGCWAFSATESFNDRRCLATNDTTLLSVQDTGACCSGDDCSHSNGCVGGFIGGAWDWFTKTGVVTGGDQSDINKTDTCEPFSLLVCTRNASKVTKEHPMCPKGEYVMPACVSKCPNTGYKTSYSNDKKFAKSSFKIKSYPLTTAYEELMTHGPISTVITVFQDFLHYKSGVYKHLSGWQIGSHAIEVIGWGVENGEKYWWVKNSWGSTWGNGGFVKIGYGEVGIENSFTAGYV